MKEFQEDKKEMKTLRDAKIGDTVKVIRLHGEGAVKRRIMDMGITKGVEVYIRKVAPLGDPVEVKVRNYELSIRKADAAMIEIEEQLPEEELTGEEEQPAEDAAPETEAEEQA